MIIRCRASARRHQHRGEVVLADRIQDGIVGLIVAVDRFDWRRGCRFSTYACWWIRHAIDRGSAGQIDTPIYAREERRRIKAAEPKLEQRLGRSPTEPDLAAATGLPLRRVSRLKETDSESEVPSLDAATADHAGTFGDRLSGDSDVYEEVLCVFQGEELRAALTELPNRSREVVTLHSARRAAAYLPRDRPTAGRKRPACRADRAADS